jgi:superfamily II DNA or RNA helicase
MLRRYRRAVRRARQPQKHARVRVRLEKLRVEDLARGRRINTAALRDAGILTAGDVYNLTEAELERIKGIGPPSAHKLRELAVQQARLRSEDLRPSANPDDWTPADFDLVRALSNLALVMALMPHLAALQSVVVTLRWLARATNWLRWLLSGAPRRAEIQSRLPGIRYDCTSAQTAAALQTLLHGLNRAAHALDTVKPHATIAQEWRANSPGLMALLEQVIGQKCTSEEREILRRGLLTRLPTELLQRIEGITLDTTRLVLHLRSYQELGAKFALAVRRGLLGDDMGLGKTIQALAAIGHAVAADGEQHHVVVCPASLIDNWLCEIRRAIPGIDGWPFHGSRRDAAFSDWLSRGGILVTSYLQAEHLFPKHLPSIGFAVVDEAHLVKNPSTKGARNVRALSACAGRVLLMGGTLMENRAGELIAVAGLADPRQGARLREQFGDGRDAHRDPECFRDALGEIYLRRNQEEVLSELPEMIFNDVRIDVGETEHLECKRALTNRNLQGARRALTVGNGIRSEKMPLLGEIISACRAEQKKVLIFSQFLDVLQAAQVVVGDGCLLLRGDVPQTKRLAVTQAFQDANEWAALVMQIDLGVGYNLQSASVVIIMEPQYKPSTETQAIKRAHRMGQTRRVVVYRLIAADSIDEDIVELTNFKAELFDQLARRSVLAEAAADSLPVHDIDESQLLIRARSRYGL